MTLEVITGKLLFWRRVYFPRETSDVTACAFMATGNRE